MGADRGSGTARAHRDRILILDFGSQYTQLIARRIREAGVYSEIHPYDCADEDLRAFAPRGIVLSGGPESVALAPADRGAPLGVRSGRPGARDLLWDADHGPAARCSGRGVAGARVRLRTSAGPWAFGPAARHRGPPEPRGSWPPRCVDEPRRSGRVPAAGVPGHRRIKVLAHRRHGRRGPPALRPAVPPRGDAHAPGQPHPRALRPRDLRRGVELGHGGHHRRGRRADPRRDRPRARAARALGWRGLGGGRGPPAPGHRRAAHLRLRGQRALEARRGRRGDGGLRRAPSCVRHRGRCRGALLRGTTRDRGPRGEAQAHRIGVHRGLRRGGLETTRRALVGARHDLPRCHRIGRRPGPARRR